MAEPITDQTDQKKPNAFGHFVRLVEAMMNAQQKYFQGGKTKTDLKISLALEGRVNKMISRYYQEHPEEKPQPKPAITQPSML